jgi:hypothetical protein
MADDDDSDSVAEEIMNVNDLFPNCLLDTYIIENLKFVF